MNDQWQTTCTCSGCGSAGGGFSTGDGGGGDADCEAQLGKDVCDQLGPMAAMLGALGAMIFVIAAVCAFWPLIICGCAWCICVSGKKKQGRDPNGTAWAVCCLLFWLLVVLTTFLTGNLLLTWCDIDAIPYRLSLLLV